ncbi:diphthine--ammonia ligase [Spirosoma soli]|uniref:Diphthine--ammonia ligase n=1 Tax=Spirosoma soli TaxID=1770529 RepID=A0ABW5M305_9BACT
MSKPKAIMSWSGGKDSALALYHALRSGLWDVTGLLTTVNEQHQRVSMHGVRTELLAAQANRLRLPLQELKLPGDVSMEVYNARMQEAYAVLRKQGVTQAIFGDIFLEDLRAYRVRELEQVGLSGVFPIWQRNSTELIHEFVDLGFRAVLVCVNEKQLDSEFVGRELDLDLLKDLPKSVDPCGENGEYHTFVYDGPIFSSPILFDKGQIVRRTYTPSGGSDCHGDEADEDAWDTGFWYQDLQLQSEEVVRPAEPAGELESDR